MKRKAIDADSSCYTSVYRSLWHRDFVALLLSESLMTVSAVVFLFLVDKTVTGLLRGGKEDVVLSLAAFCFGLFLLGPLVAWLADRYRRNAVFVISTLLLAAVFGAVSYLYVMPVPKSLVCKETVWCACLLSGSFYGLSKRLLIGVLMIDKSESCYRNEANNAAMWVSCVSVCLGTALAEQALGSLDCRVVAYLVPLAVAVAAAIVASLSFPFRTPVYEGSVFSLDRFVMFRGWQYLFLLLIASALSVCVMAACHDWSLYAMLLVGIIVAMLTHEAVKRNMRERGEIVIGLLMMCLSLLAVLCCSAVEAIAMAFSLLLGMSWGYVAGGTMDCLLSSCEHCRRGTVVCSHFFAGAVGILAGACIGLLR